MTTEYQASAEAARMMLQSIKQSEPGMLTAYSRSTGLRVIDQYGRHVESRSESDILTWLEKIDCVANWYVKEIPHGT